MNRILPTVISVTIAWAPLTLSAQHDDISSRIVAADPEVRALLREGSDRSETLRALIGTLEESRWRVFIRRGQCKATALRSCLLHFIGTSRGEPYLQIVITLAGRHRDQVIVSLAHELQHALEVARAPEVVDVATLRALFRRIGFVRVRTGLVTAYETRAAEQVSHAVLRELRRTQRETPLNGPQQRLDARCPCRSGPVAQLGARMNGVHEVTGSIPVWSTIRLMASHFRVKCPE